MLFEAFFYGAFAVSLLLPRPIRLPALTLALGILSAIGWTIGGNGPAAQVYLSPIMLEFVLGAWLHVSWQAKWLSRPVVGCVAIVSGLIAFIALRDVDPENWRVLVWGIPSLLVVGGALSLEGSIPRVATLLLLGDASYAIYLFHRFIVGPVHLFAVPALWKPPIFVALLAVSVSLGVIVHLLVERPMTSVLRGLRPKAAPRPDATPFRAAP
jgi:exopolysaccharide production protein ExoZ